MWCACVRLCVCVSQNKTKKTKRNIRNPVLPFNTTFESSVMCIYSPSLYICTYIILVYTCVYILYICIYTLVWKTNWVLLYGYFVLKTLYDHSITFSKISVFLTHMRSVEFVQWNREILHIRSRRFVLMFSNCWSALFHTFHRPWILL